MKKEENPSIEKIFMGSGTVVFTAKDGTEVKAKVKDFCVEIHTDSIEHVGCGKIFTVKETLKISADVKKNKIKMKGETCITK